ncbi:MAG: peptidylprolyl isomerase, partial [Burkholderiales bacterium]
PDSVLEAQILQRLITERLQSQEAARQKVVVTGDMVKQAIDIITSRNKLTSDQMRKQIEASGVSWDEYREMIKREITLERLRQKVIDSTINISDAEVDANLREQKARQEGGLASGLARPGTGQPQAAAPAQASTQAPSAPGQPAVLGLAQILVRVPEGSSPDQVKALRDRAQGLLARIKAGESFETLATSSSDGSEAIRGGDMGARPVEAWPDLFVTAVANVKDGGVSNVIQSGNGFHILKVMGRAGGGAAAPARAAVAPAPPPQQPQPGPGRGQPPAAPQGPMNVQQTRAHHILIKTSEIVPDDIARQKLTQLYDRIVKGGEPFEDLAKRFSNDASAPQGGDLGWLNPGETVPPFEQAMNALKIGEVSPPVKTQFGWHIIRVDDRRTQDIAEQFQRNQARQRLFQQRAESSFEAWLQQVRNQSYIDNRLEKRQRQDKE